MCGIGAILKVTRPGEPYAPIPDSWLDSIDAEIAWRGPDGSGRFRDVVTLPSGTTVEVAMVHRRLSIIDHAGGGQPFIVKGCPACDAANREHRRKLQEFIVENDAGYCETNENVAEDLTAVVFNGCIYNHRELRVELESLGHVFTSDHSDTEVIAHAWSQWREEHPMFANDEFSKRLDGMYAIALWNRGDAMLWTARDRYGEKPLYVRRSDETTVIVASSVPALRSIPSENHAPSLGEKCLADWVAMGYSAITTPIQQINQLAPGSVEAPTLATKGIRKASPKHPDSIPFLSPDDIGSALERAVASRLEADVPLASFLSGGIDSSLIAFYARKQLGRLTTVCVRMPDDRLNESSYAEQVASQLDTDHVTLDLEASAANDLHNIITTLGLPIGDSSILPTYWLCKATASHAKVALSGDGGDELFGGYNRYRAARLIGLPPTLMIGAMFFPEGILNRSDPQGRSERVARFIEAIRNRGYTDLVSIFSSTDYARLVAPKHFSLVKLAPLGSVFNQRRYIGPDAARLFDMEHYLPGDLLRKVDTASMMCGLEVRCPMLHPSVASRAIATPWRVLCPGKRPKGMLRELARRHLGDAIADRPKQGFAIPISEWWRNDFGGLRTLLFDYLDKPKPFGVVHDALPINMDYVRQMIDEHWAAGGLTPIYTTRQVQRRDHGQRLFSLLTLAIWARDVEHPPRKD